MPDRATGGAISRAVLAGTILLLVMVSATIRAAASRPHWYQEVESLGVHVISARELKRMLDRGESTVIIDARDEIHYRNGRLSGALSIPAEDAPLAAVDARRTKRLLHPERLPADRATVLVFYCGGIT